MVQDFALQEADTWHQADEQMTVWEQSRRGQIYRVEIKAWHNMLMSGKRKPKRLPMHRYPFTLVQVVRYDQEGKLACKRPMWLLAIGEQRQQLSAQDIYEPNNEPLWEAMLNGGLVKAGTQFLDRQIRMRGGWCQRIGGRAWCNCQWFGCR